MAHDKVLLLLRVLERYTGIGHGLKKEEILDILDQESNISMDDKTFLSCINSLKDAGYPVESTKGRNAMYYLKQSRMSEGELVFLCALISGCPDLSEKEAADLCQHFLEDYQYRFPDALQALYAPLQQAHMHSSFNRIRGFSCVVKAMLSNQAIRLKIASTTDKGTVEFSEWKTVYPQGFRVLERRMEMIGIEDGRKVAYAIGDLVDVRIPEEK